MRKIISIVILILLLIEGCVQQPINPKKPEASVEEIKEIQEEQEETKENCTTGWKCLDEYEKGYQFPNCVFTQVNICPNGCKDGECLPAPQGKEKEGTFSLKEGIDTVKELDWKSCDFSEGQIFEDGVTNQDFKIKLYEKVSGYNYFRVESSEPAIWIINKGIADATREDCTEKIVDAKIYGYLRTKQTLCIKTKENNIALIGGYWDGSPAEDTKLYWKYYS